GAKSTEQLMNRILKRPFVSNAAFDAFRNELALVFLEVTVCAAFLHRADRTHAAIGLVTAALVNFRFARAFFRTSKEASQHYATSTSCNSLSNFAGVLDTAVGDDRYIVFTSNRCTIVDRRNLWYADTCDNTRRTDRTRTDTDFNDGCASFD